ncbi:MAG: PD-(D/E)XK nuclease family protein [Acidobacteriaceae bacterium]
MDGPHTLLRQIQQALEQGWTVVTANQRAARTLHREFDLQQLALGLAHWQPPAILAWDTWLVSVWHRLLLDGHAFDLLLNPTQEHTLWRDLIAADTAPDGAALSLRPIDALAELAAGAWRLLHDYRARRRLQASVSNADTRAFARWAGEFDRRCARAQFLTEAQLPETLRAVFSAGRIAPPTGLLLVGFDLRNPAQTALLDTLATAGSVVEELEHPSATPSLTLVDAPDRCAELSACALWLRARLTRQPASRIAVIVPAIETARAEIDRVFRQTLAPELNHIAAPANSGPYEFSLGVPLASTPMAAAALDILRWATGALPLDRVSALLLSPHFAANSSPTSSEYLARAEFDAFVLRRQPLLQPQVSLDDLHALASNPKHGASNLTLLLRHMNALRDLFPRIDRAERSYADWGAAFHELLEAAGWAALSHLDSTEFQTRRKWDDALDELASLDFDSRSDGARVSFADALDALIGIASQTLFAPESRHAPIQIMGPLESAGSSFDALWFLGADDLSWPARPTPNPLLPWLLQRELAMPGADPAHDAAHARRITQRIAASAPTVLFSYAKQSTEKGRQRPSPLVAGLAVIGLTSTGLALERRSAHQIAPAEPAPAPIQLEALPHDAPIPPPPDRVLQGGASILQSQAACPFRAFAEKRLFASALDPASLGLDPRQRGSLVHSILERFWAKVQTQAALKLLSTAERNDLLNQSIEAAFARDYAHPASGWPRAYLNTERQRLLKLLGPWLDYEAGKRSPFTVQSREEKLEDVQIGPLRLDIRIDRVDLALTDDEPTNEIILDYKTGPAHPADWLGDRPDQPQLPLYAVVSNRSNLAAIAFASVRPGKDMGLQGYQSRDGILPKAAQLKAASLQDQVREWRDVLTALAEDFYSGQASVSPKNYPVTCAHCHQRLLCRLDPSTLDVNVIDEDADAGPNSSDSDTPEAAHG